MRLNTLPHSMFLAGRASVTTQGSRRPRACHLGAVLSAGTAGHKSQNASGWSGGFYCTLGRAWSVRVPLCPVLFPFPRAANKVHLVCQHRLLRVAAGVLVWCGCPWALQGRMLGSSSGPLRRFCRGQKGGPVAKMVARVPSLPESMGLTHLLRLFK